MTPNNKEKQIRMLYEEAVYWHNIHSGCNIHRETIRVRPYERF